MSLVPILDRRVVLVSGKGGVGRTTASAALARAAARAGKRVLVTEIEEPAAQTQSSLARMFGREVLPTRPVLLAPGIHGCVLSTEHGTEQFLGDVFRVQTLARMALRNAALRRLLHAGPSFHEMGVFYHLLHLIRMTSPDGRPRFDFIVLDMPATGHTLALTGLPDILLRLVRRGPIASALREGQGWLNDRRTGTAIIVTIPEPLPVTESLELVAGLRSTRMDVGAIFVNRIPVDPFDDAQRAALAELLPDGPLYGKEELERLERARLSIERLREHARVPLVFVPQFDADGVGATEAMAEHLSEELRR
ncbi:MAG: ArsA family ATPase [Alphaproteobacteria bacterium]|nr:ArsA family ATPase [Alphaproteobacteria bacterium]